MVVKFEELRRFIMAMMPPTLRLRLWRYRSLIERVVAYACLLAFWRKPPRRTFIIFGQGRSGSSLLAQLLRCNPEIHCDDEILMRRVLWPDLCVKALSMRHPGKVYGFKLRFHELASIQKVDPREFLLAHHRRGGRIIHLRRENMLRQAISGLIARAEDLWVMSDRRGYEARRNKRFHIDGESVLRNLKWRETMLVQEQEVLRDIPHIPVVYERDLLDGRRHQETLNMLFDYLGVDRVPVRAKLMRLAPDNLADVVENFDEVAEVVANSAYASLLSSEIAGSPRSK